MKKITAADGTNYTIKSLAMAAHMTTYQVRYRLSKGMPIEDILAGKAPKHGNPDNSLQALAKEHGISYQTLYGRVQRGMTIEEALSFDPESAREAQRKYHTEEERKAAHREAARRHYRKKRATLAVRDTVERIHEAETKARKEALKQLRKDIRDRWFASPEYLRLRQRRQEESREAAHDERKFVREALKGMILECPPGAERELAQWMLDHLDDDVLRVRQVDEFLAEFSSV